MHEEFKNEDGEVHTLDAYQAKKEEFAKLSMRSLDTSLTDEEKKSIEIEISKLKDELNIEE